ncbi:MAG: peptidase domain protein [Parcubacteria group bacterium]|nr:peptidase domain protein [Parcubacteria group bacterium]
MATFLPYACALLGAVLASFAGVISERLYTGESWVVGHSRCNSCNRTLTGRDLIPIISWLIHRGRCWSCKAPIPYRYALSELILAAVFYAAALRLGAGLALVLLLAAFFILAIVVLYDLRHTVVPMPLALLLIATSGAYLLVTGSRGMELASTLMVAGAIGLGFFLMHALSSGRWMGLGDAPIALALSLIAGKEAFAGLLFSFWIGAVIGIFILVLTPRGHRMGIEVPFVPFLACGYLLAFFTQWNPFLF